MRNTTVLVYNYMDLRILLLIRSLFYVVMKITKVCVYVPGFLTKTGDI